MNEMPPGASSPGEEQAFRVAYLVAGFLRNTLTDLEHTELDDWIAANMDNQRLFEQLIDEKNQAQWRREMEQIDTETALQNVQQKLLPKKPLPMLRSSWLLAAAAVLLIVLVTSFFILRNHHTTETTGMAQNLQPALLPGSDKAMLTLSDGTNIQLDSLQNGGTRRQGSVQFTKLDSGQLAYQQKQTVLLQQELAFNTLSVPDGGQYKLVLPDGTKVWLNAGSSLKYPTAFNMPKRVVELSGEAYFEVARDTLFPFVVKTKGTTVEVLGTHFNVNAYADEPVTSVVLEEGSVKLNNSMVLKPGQVGMLDSSGRLSKSVADIDMALGWKNGQFIFKETPVDVLMRQVARWYKADIIYQTNIQEHFNAQIPRTASITELLRLLEGTGRLHFSVTDNKITVMK